MEHGVKCCPQHGAGEERIGSRAGEGPQGEGTAAEMMENTTESEGLEGTEWMVGNTTDESPQEWGHKANRVRAPGDTAGQEERRKQTCQGQWELSPMKAKPSRTWALTAGASVPHPPPEPGFQPVVCQPQGKGCE